MLRTAAKTEILHVPFRGPAPAKQAVLAGDVSLICDNLSNVIEDARAGSLKPIALSAPKRHAQAADIPTTAEQGYPLIDAGIWYSLVVPKGTPPTIVERLNKEFARALNLPDVKSKLDNLALTIVADSPAAFGAFLKAETARWKQAIEAAGVKVE